MKKTIALLLALLLVASGLSVFASRDLVDPPYTVKMKAAITAGEGIEPIEPELPGDRPGEIENGEGLSIVVGRSASKQTLGAEYTNADSLVTLEQYGEEGNEIVADLSGNSPNTAAVDNVYFYVAAAAVPRAESSTTVTFSCNDGWVKTGDTATPSQANIPIYFAADDYETSGYGDYHITSSATETGTVDATMSKSAEVTVSTTSPETSPTWRFVGEVIAVWPQTTGYQVGDYTAEITVAVTTP